MAKRKGSQELVKDDGKEPKSLVEIAKARYERAKENYDSQRLLSIEDTRFVMGDSDNGWQWPQAIYRDRANINKKPCLTVNVTAQHCNQIINQIRQNRPSARILPVDDHADVETAKILGGMLRAIQAESSADTAHDTGAEHAIYGGEGYWRIVTEYEDYNSFNQVIRIRPLMNPLLVYVDPDAKEPDRSDANWGFVFEDISKERAREDHPDVDPLSWVEDPRGWVKGDKVRRAEYFWCEYVDDKLYLLEDGTTVLKSEFPDGFEAKDGAILNDGVPVVGVVYERSTKRKQWKWCKLLGGETEPVDERDWPGQYFPIITVLGKEVNVNGDIIRKGIVRDLKDPARMLNYSFSAAVETLALQNKVPYLAANDAIEGFEDIWGAANLENRSYLPWNHVDDEGNPIPKPERQPTASMPVAQVQMLQLATEQMRAASGQQSANFGIKSEAASGVGIQRLKQQGEIATFHFPDNLARALKYEAKVILDLIPKVYEQQRVVRILGLDGKQESAMLNPDMPQAYAETNASVEKIFNPGVGRYDVVIDTGPSYATQRQEASAAMTELASKYPPLMDVAGDIVMRTYDFPMAEELADRMKKLPTIAPLIDEKGNEQIPPQAQAAMQQMEQQLQQLDQAIQGMEQELSQTQDKQRQAELKAQMEESKRIKAETENYVLRAQKQLDSDKQQAISEVQAAFQQPVQQPEANPEQEAAEADAEAQEMAALQELAGMVQQLAGQNEQVMQALQESTNLTVQAISQMQDAIVRAQTAPKRATLSNGRTIVIESGAMNG
ncbi:portal protein [Hydrogenophaga laconesensis]|uniref:Molecular chaperone GrpE (Heat shock protein) n=1 Tax=Hydrogenophaga laconesensis TaxID=1805971 RepID=A0ABU1V9W9_9BURK|nr:portal protein [Hydrogenophaga laconesensis]MDR7094145.1 molecular chaperone GrpE (heat shock protein) [Hydrogenophaga laconesensis]